MTGRLVPAPFALVVAGPSGAGKTTLCRQLLARRTDVRFSVSATTRAPRADEVDGVHYRFLDRATFEELRARGGLLEWAEVHGELYGTPAEELAAAHREGKHLLLDIDVQGARSVCSSGHDAVTVFVLPPNGERIVKRLRHRGSESQTALRTRLRRARSELLAVPEFDYVVVNDDLQEAVGVLEAILEAERHRVSRVEEAVRNRALELADEIERALE